MRAEEQMVVGFFFFLLLLYQFFFVVMPCWESSFFVAVKHFFFVAVIPPTLNAQHHMQEHMDRFKGSRAISSSDYFDNSPGDGQGQVFMVGIHFIILMFRWTGLALWKFEFIFSGSLISTFLTKPSSFTTGN